MSSWTLASELAGMQHPRSGHPLKPGDLGLELSNWPDLSSATVLDWYRAGSESYIYVFELAVGDVVKQFVIKACISSNISMSLTDTVSELLRRRTLLSSHGIAVPKLYGRERATILEEFIPFTLREAIRQSVDGSKLIESLGAVAGTLTGLGFPCLSLDDLRSRGSDAVLIDFGEDLGPEGQMSPDNTSILDQACSMLERSGLATTADYSALEAGFSNGLNAVLER